MVTFIRQSHFSNWNKEFKCLRKGVVIRITLHILVIAVAVHNCRHIKQITSLIVFCGYCVIECRRILLSHIQRMHFICSGIYKQMTMLLTGHIWENGKMTMTFCFCRTDILYGNMYRNRLSDMPLCFSVNINIRYNQVRLIHFFDSNDCLLRRCNRSIVNGFYFNGMFTRSISIVCQVILIGTLPFRKCCQYAINVYIIGILTCQKIWNIRLPAYKNTTVFRFLCIYNRCWCKGCNTIHFCNGCI